MIRAAATAAAPADPRDATMEALFPALDADGSGGLSLRETRVPRLGRVRPEGAEAARARGVDAAALFFHEVDADGDGALSPSEAASPSRLHRAARSERWFALPFSSWP